MDVGFIGKGVMEQLTKKLNKGKKISRRRRTELFLYHSLTSFAAVVT
jgi:hypothetical protein